MIARLSFSGITISGANTSKPSNKPMLIPFIRYHRVASTTPGASHNDRNPTPPPHKAIVRSALRSVKRAPGAGQHPRDLFGRGLASVALDAALKP
jgi:hypothetical protein